MCREESDADKKSEEEGVMQRQQQHAAHTQLSRNACTQTSTHGKSIPQACMGPATHGLLMLAAWQGEARARSQGLTAHWQATSSRRPTNKELLRTS